jgi:hypothetical protein
MNQLTNGLESEGFIMICSNLLEMFDLTVCRLVIHEGSVAATPTISEPIPSGLLNYATRLATSIQGGAGMPNQKLTQVRKQP